MIIIIVAFIFMINIIIIILLYNSFIQSYLLFYEHTDGRSNSPFRSLHRRSESPTRSMGSTTRKSESPIRYTSRSMYVNNNELKSSDSAKEKIDEERKANAELEGQMQVKYAQARKDLDDYRSRQSEEDHKKKLEWQIVLQQNKEKKQ